MTAATRRLAFGALAALAGLLTPPPARAQTIPADSVFAYEWAIAGAPVTGAYAATAGSAFTLQVYLRQTAGSTDVLAQQNGLFAGGVRATYGGAPAAGTPPGTPGVIAVTSPADVRYNPQFDNTALGNQSRQANATFAQFAAVKANAPPNGTGVLPVGGRVLLGEFTFQTQGAVGATTNLTAETIPPSTFADTITFQDFFVLDPRISNASLAITVVPVPEPAGLLALGAVGAAGVRRARRRARVA